MTNTINQRLEYLRQEIRAERISYAEIAELQSLAEHIDPSDTELLEWAGVPEAMGEQQFKKAVKSEEVKKDHTKTTLGELLSSNSDGIRRCAISILKQIQKK